MPEKEPESISQAEYAEFSAAKPYEEGKLEEEFGELNLLEKDTIPMDMVGKVRLNNGQMMPLLGLGTSQNYDKDSIVNAVSAVGYRLIDTAQVY